jgi:hypothetical protein
MHRRTLLLGLLASLYPGSTWAHSPWGQYAVYRQKHLLILSTRDDPESYGYSKILVDAINKEAPEANARPARAINLERAYNLLRTDQFQFALLSPQNIDAMRSASGPFEGKASVDLKTLYSFGTLELAVVGHFPSNLAAIVTDAILNSLSVLPQAASPEEILTYQTLHPGAREAILVF